MDTTCPSVAKLFVYYFWFCLDKFFFRFPQRRNVVRGRSYVSFFINQNNHTRHYHPPPSFWSPFDSSLSLSLFVSPLSSPHTFFILHNTGSPFQKKFLGNLKDRCALIITSLSKSIELYPKQKGNQYLIFFINSFYKFMRASHTISLFLNT